MGKTTYKTMSNDIPFWLKGDYPVRKRSEKQEKKLAKRYGGRKTANSGAVFKQNDVETDDISIEAKFTDNKGYRITVEEIKRIEQRAGNRKIPVELIEFSKHGTSIVIIPEFYFNRMVQALSDK
jgi:hypothetical protein